MLAALVLTASINVDIDLGALIRRNQQVQAPAVTCGIKTVGYRFVGAPGQQFRYAGETWTVPPEGRIELIADRNRETYSIAGRTLPLNVAPHDQFGFREIDLPATTK
jgi:hypothetical protein